MRRSILTICLPILGAVAPVRERESGLASLVRTPTVALEALRKDPDRWLGLRVKLTVAWGEEKPFGNPYFTRFNSLQHVRFAARSGTSPLWEPQVYSSEFSHLFVAKDSPHLTALRGAKRNELVGLTVVVRDAFRGVPWCEVVGAKLSRTWTPEGTLIAVARARKLLSEGQRPLALDQLQQAMVEPLPRFEKVALLKEIAALQAEIRETSKAKETLRVALELAPDDRELQEALRGN